MHAQALLRSRSLILAATALTVVMTGERAHAQPGWVLSPQKIDEAEGGFTGPLTNWDHFGYSTALLGDLDGDGVGELAVGAWEDNGVGLNRGAVWILFLNSNGTVKAHQRINNTEGGGPPLDPGDRFGTSVASLGDFDGDGVVDLAVGAYGDDDGGGDRGAVWILLLNTNGTVKSYQKISSTQGGFTGTLTNHDLFGTSVASLGDLDGDDVGDLAVGARFDDDGGGDIVADVGAVWVLFLNANGTVKSHQKISDLEGEFTGVLDLGDSFGFSATSLGDFDGDDVNDLAVGAVNDGDGGVGHGAVWLLFLNTDGTVKSHQKISDTQGGFMGELEFVDWFGSSVTCLDDLDGDGISDLAVGAFGDDDGGGWRGAVWVLFLNPDGTVKSHQKISSTEGGFNGTINDGSWFGISVASLGDLDGDGVGDLTVGAARDNDGASTAFGAVWILFLDGVPTATPAALTSCSLTFGSTDNDPCDVANLVDDDDIDQILRSQFGFTAFERNLTEIVIQGNAGNATTMTSIDTRDGSDTTNVVAKVNAWNYVTNSVADIAQYDVSFPSDDTSHTTPVNSPDFIKFNGDIKIRLRYVAPATFTPLGFTVGLDSVQVLVD